MGVLLNTLSGPLRRLLTTNDTTAGTSIADPADTLTNPETAEIASPYTTGVLRIGAGGDEAPNWLKIFPYGTDTAAQNFLMAVYAIERINQESATAKEQWSYHLLAGFTCTLGTKAGLTNGVVNASQLYCTTITLNTNEGNANVSCEIVTPGSNRAAHVIVDVKGSELARILFARNSSAASMNALVGKG